MLAHWRYWCGACLWSPTPTLTSHNLFTFRRKLQIRALRNMACPLMALRQSCLDALADSVLAHPKLDAITRAAA